ncbi:cytochrome p450 [Lasallia pustulata]|uniref:Cytochrome p450 n=1 Tax=Lasallia pustulata TaxID=136370 RepID=A0A1W5CXI0_9LECA|nr:cytochrome p450 [Lasallia pustulata]
MVAPRLLNTFHKDPFLGLDMFFDDFKSMERGNTASAERERFLNYGKPFEANSWGKRCLQTMGVANIQAFLS